MFKENNFRPLPKTLTIRKSDIDGLGLFAKEDIPAKTELGVSHLYVWNMWIRTPLGGFINHSPNPNCSGEDLISENVEYRTLITLKDIKEGEELTKFYTLEEYTRNDLTAT